MWAFSLSAFISEPEILNEDHSGAGDGPDSSPGGWAQDS